MTSTARTERNADSGRTDPGDAPEARWRRWPQAGRCRTDVAVCLAYLVLAGWVTLGMWPDPGARVLSLNPEDQALYEWFLATDARILHGDFSLLSDRLNAPDGVNLMANTTVIAIGFVLAPVTLLAGAPTTFALVAAGNLAGTAIAWYLLYTRTLRIGRLAAGLGAGFCGFAPGMVSQSNAHLHMTAQWLIPVMIWLLVRLVRAADPRPAAGTAPTAVPRAATDPRPAAGAGVGRRDWRGLVSYGALLALAVTVQVFVGEEVLFLAAVALVVMAVAYAVADPSLARRALPAFTAGMLVAVGLAVVALAYPLWFQFAGPQSVPNGMFSPHYFSADLASWPAFSPLSIAGSESAAELTTGAAEYNTFLGWPVLLVAAACAGWLIRRPLVIACVAAGLLMAALSLGPIVVVGGEQTGVDAPYSLLLGLPVVDGALPMRFALALIPLIATVLAIAVDRARRSGRREVQMLMPVAVVAALLPLFPWPLPTAARPAVPEFITAGHWRDCVEPGGVLVPVPLATPKEPWPMRWATAANADFSMPEGFFIGPYAAGGEASMGTSKRPTSTLLAQVVTTGMAPAVTDGQRQQAQHDVAFWGASCVALADGAPHADQLRDTLEQLLGPGIRVADAWTWRVS